MELRNLITFINVVELKSFTKAAEQLGYSQSTISFQIKQLEEELNCLLFERINHNISLTERGKELLTYAHQVRSLTDEFKDNLKNETDYNGYIHIVTPDSVCEDMINTNYLDFYSKYPNISLKFTPADTTVMFEMLNRNEADVIITLDNHIYHKDYVIEKDQPLSMHFVASVNNPLSKMKNLSIKDIVTEPFLLTEKGQGYRRVFDNELSKKSLEIQPVLEIGRTDIITSLLTKGNMISFLPDFVSYSKVKAGKLCYLDVTDFNIEICKQLIYRKNKWLSKSLIKFIEYVKKAEFKN